MSRVVIAIVAGLLSGAWLAAAQPPSHGGTHSSHGAHQSHGGAEPHRRMQAMLQEIDQVIAQGLGAGLAFPADQNGYPGPLHVLELKGLLALTPEQEARIAALHGAMFAESRPKSARLVEAEAALRRVFSEARADEARVRAAAAAVERARTEVRLVHLLTHLRTRDVLTEEQRRLYHEARWGTR
jgi:Spy/CpxP family protein refolding chaperone